MIIILLMLALAPGIAIAFYIYYKDHHEPEPVRLLVMSFIFGMISVFLALAINVQLNRFLDIDDDTLWSQAIHAFLVVAFVEELCKFTFVRGLLYPQKDFNEAFDGIVYSVMVAMGFATAENIYYVLNGGVEIAFLRMFSAVPAHGVFAVIMGFFIGEAKFLHRNEIFYLLAGLLIATAVHGLYDLFLFMTFVPGIWILAFVSLFGAYLLSRVAIRLHQETSPFKNEPSGPDD